jgi:hypothetical protein
MLGFRKLVGSIFVTYFIFSFPAAAQTIASSRFEGWDLSSHRSATTGQFTHCAASARYNSGVSLLYSVNHRFDWNMGFASNSWNLQTGTQVPIVYAIDALPPRAATAIAVNNHHVVVPLPDDPRLFQQMRAGLRMTVTGAGQTLTFNLTRTSVVLATLLACANDSGRSVQVQVPSSPPPQAVPVGPQVATSPRGTTGVTADMRIEATQFVANLLSQANMRGFRILTRTELQSDQLSSFIRTSDVVWQGEGSFGTLHIRPNHDVRELDGLAADVIAWDARVCAGEFITGRTSDPEMTNVRRLHTFCRTPDGALETISYLLIPMPGRLVYQLSTVAPLSRSEAEPEDRRLRDAVHAVISRHPALGPGSQPARPPEPVTRPNVSTPERRS